VSVGGGFSTTFKKIFFKFWFPKFLGIF